MSKIKFQTTEAKGKGIINLYGGNLEAFKSKDKTLILVGAAGTGKLEDCDNLIPTPSGWTRFGDLKPGDEVFSEKGLPIKVIEVFPQGFKQLYKVSFNDGSSVEVGGEHLWIAWTKSQRETFNNPKRQVRGRTGNPKLLTTLELKENIHKRFTIPITEAVQYSKKDLLIHPYIMGVLIGDGTVKYSPSISTNDQFIVDKVNKLLPKDHTLKYNSKYDYYINSNGKKNIIKNYFKNLDFLCENKFIPKEYLQSSIEDRIHLLQGLIDTDGCIDKRGMICYYTISKKLSENFKELVESLGGICKIKTKIPFYTYKGEKKQGKLCYVIHVNLPNGIQACSLPRKVERLNLTNRKYLPMRKIVSIEPTSVKETMCISVFNPSGLYLTKDYIVTHNTLTLCLKMHLFAVFYPGVKILLARKTLPALRNTVVKTYQDVLEMTGYTNRVRVLGETRPTQFIYKEDSREHNGVTYSGVSEIVLSNIAPDGKALGAEYDMIYINQPDTEGLTEDEFSLVASRCRAENGPYRQIIADPNPASDQHWLLKGSYIQPKTGKPKWKMIQSFHKDNPAYFDHEKNEWTPLGLEHLEQLESLPEHLRQSQLEGKWFSTEGAAFSNSWNSNKHIISLGDPKALELGISKFNEETEEYENAIPHHWHHYVAMDWGGTDPYAILLIAKHPEHDLFIVHKHIYTVELDLNKITQMIHEMIDGYEIKDIIADRGPSVTNFVENKLGIMITNAKKGAGSVEDSINICNNELLSDRWLFLNTSESLFNEPDMDLIRKKKVMGVEEIPNLKLDATGKGIAKHQQDHFYDAWKYFCRYWVGVSKTRNHPVLLWN